MDETSIAGPSQDLPSFLAFLRMLLSEGEVEGGVGIVHCGLAITASGLIGLPQLCVVSLLVVAVAAPMVVVHLLVDAVSRVSLMMLAMRDLSSSPAIFSTSLAFFCSLLFFSTAEATALLNLAFLDLVSLLSLSAPPLIRHSWSSVFCSFVSLEYLLLS